MIKAPDPKLGKDEVLRLFDGITVWKKGGERAPHKPLLALLALARCLNSGGRTMRYTEIEPALREMLSAFGPPRQVCHTEYPFWRLQKDHLWTVSANGPLEPRKSNSDPKKSELVKYKAEGGFPPAVFNALKSDPELAREVARRLLEAHFPESMHADILNSVGLPPVDAIGPRKGRDAEFRTAVIRAYQHQCAICGYDVRLANTDLGVEAAHIKWYQAGGPDVVPNGLCLCVLHHRVFDRGAIGISETGRLLVSEEVHGGSGLEEWLLRFEGKPLRKPQRMDYNPRPEFVGWHLKEVFRTPARQVN
jgi:putative restriction endonuclease